MIFNSINYAIFLSTTLLIYYHLRHREQNLFLLGASYLFYSFWDVRFLSLIIISTIVDYNAGLRIEAARLQNDQKGMRTGLVISLVTNLGILGFFKYFNFFIDSAEKLLSSLGVSISLPVLQIILPVGISFYTFQTLSYTIDIYRGKLKPVHNFFDFALFVSFFPQLVAGPIERAVNLLPQIQKPRLLTKMHWDRGLYLILVGLVRKIVIADTAGIIADPIFENPAAYTSLQLLIGLILYSLQIYGDFSGYSNIARGSAMLLGFDLIRNFHHPYFAVNVSDFWRRWHISLSGWLRDYLYIPLGGNRRGKFRTYLNLLITMLLGGLWHGASWNFIFWGFLHGIYLAVHRILRTVQSQHFPKPSEHSIRWGTYLSIIATYSLVSFTWLFFRITDFSTIRIYLTGIGQLKSGGLMYLIPMGFLLLAMLLIDIPQAINDDEFIFLRLPTIPRAVVISASLLLIIFSSGGNKTPFIYFQF